MEQYSTACENTNIRQRFEECLAVIIRKQKRVKTLLWSLNLCQSSFHIYVFNQASFESSFRRLLCMCCIRFVYLLIFQLF